MSGLTLSDLLVDSRDGDWGVDDATEGHSPHFVIRGADFPAVRELRVDGVPLRYMPDRTVQRRLLQADDILIETAGGTRDRPTGRVLLITQALLDQFSAPVTCASFARFLRADPTKVAPRYLYWYLQAVHASGETFEYQVQHTGVARFQYTVFATTRSIKLPSGREQAAIAEVLGAMDDKIAANSRLSKTVSALLSAEFARVTASAEIGQLGEIADVNAESTKAQPSGSIHYVDIASVGVGSYQLPAPMDWTEAPGRARRVLRRGDTVWSTVRPNRRSHALVLDDADNLIASTGLAVLTPRRDRFAYVYEATRTDAFTAYLEGVAEGSAYPAVRGERFVTAPVRLAHDEVISRFEAMAAPMRLRSHSATVESRTLAEIRDALLPQLMSGKIRVKDAERVVEGVV